MTQFFPTPDYTKIRQDFLDDLIRASKNQPSSISYIKYVFPKKPLITSGIIQAFVIGGTNYESSKASINNGLIKKVTTTPQKGRVPQFSDAKTFLQFMGKLIDPTTDAISISFAYPLEPTIGSFGEVDGILRKGGTKEHTFTGLLNNAIGQSLKDYLKLTIPVTVANDTICLGKNALVVGSGLNIAVNDTNLEAGSFDKFAATPELETIDKQSKNVRGRYEKMLSGTYLPLQYNLLARKHKLNVPEIKHATKLSKLAQTNTHDAGNLARALLERSASLVATALAAVYIFSKQKKLVFQTDGSLFWNGWNYKKNVQKQLHTLSISQKAIEFVGKKNIAIQGALELPTRIQ